MSTLKFVLLVNLLSCFFSSGFAIAGEITVIHAGKLLAIPGQSPLGPTTIVIRKGKVDAVIEGLKAPGQFADKRNTVKLVDLSDRFVLPGMMDAHVHIMAQPSAFIRNAMRRGAPFTNSDFAMHGVLYAQRTLAAGFTTIRDVGSNNESVFALRNAINRGDLPGPTILAAGPVMSATGGHGDRGSAATTSLDPNERISKGVCDGAAECTRTVRYLKQRGSDLIKFTATGGFMTDTGTQQQYDTDEIQAIISAAHQRGMKVAAHAYDAEAIKQAVTAGVDSIEHGWLLDDEGIKLMKKKGTYLVPTLLISRPSSWANKAGTGKASELRDEHQAFEKAYAKGVNIAFGTDVGIYDHGQNALEFSVMVELGMTTADAIRTATVNTAALLGISDQAGTIEVGKRADLIAVNGNPLDDISLLQRVEFVMKQGTVYKTEGNYIGTVVVPPTGKPVSLR